MGCNWRLYRDRLSGRQWGQSTGSAQGRVVLRCVALRCVVHYCALQCRVVSCTSSRPHAQGTGENLVLLVRATDLLDYPHVDCTSCAVAPTMQTVSDADMASRIHDILGSPIASVQQLLNLLTITAKASIPKSTSDLFLVWPATLRSARMVRMSARYMNTHGTNKTHGTHTRTRAPQDLAHSSTHNTSAHLHRHAATPPVHLLLQLSPSVACPTAVGGKGGICERAGGGRSASLCPDLTPLCAVGCSCSASSPLEAALGAVAAFPSP